MICRMAKPEEVLIVEDENGNIVRETMKDLDILVQYKVYLPSALFSLLFLVSFETYLNLCEVSFNFYIGFYICLFMCCNPYGRS